MNNKFPNRGSFQSFGLFLSKKEEARGSRRYGQPAKLPAAAGGPARPIHPSTYQSRAQLLAHDISTEAHAPIIIALRGPHARPVGAGPCALASSGLRSTENRVHGGTPSLLPPLIVVAGAAPLPPGLPNPPPRRSPPASSAPLRGSPAAAAFAGDVCYESRGRLRDGRCAVLGSLRLRRAAPRGRAWDW